MSRRHYGLPPLTTLAAFEAAARHLSFKDAAQELSVTPGAVSHQIKALEGDLGSPLFKRVHRGVELTKEGLGLFNTLSSSFRDISRELTNIREGSEADSVTIGSTTAVAALWLSPAIIRLWRDHPDLNIHQITQDRPFNDSRDFDLIIRCGRNHDARLEQIPLYRDVLVPVATPETAQKLQDCSLATLAEKRLIHVENASQTWTTWGEWFHELGYGGKIHSGARVTNYSVALQMARKDVGIALGWKRLIKPMLDSGKLVVVGPHALPAPNEFFLIGRPDAELSANARKLKDWLLLEAKSGSV